MAIALIGGAETFDADANASSRQVAGARLGRTLTSTEALSAVRSAPT